MLRIQPYGQKLEVCLICKNTRAKLFCRHCNGQGQFAREVYHIEGVEYGHGSADDATVSDSIDRLTNQQ